MSTNLFIVGMPRSGTTWLMKCFNEHPQTVCFGESSFFGRNYVKPNSDGKYTKQEVEYLCKKMAGMSITLENNNFFERNKVGSYKHIDSISNFEQIINNSVKDITIPIKPNDLFNQFAEFIAKAEKKLFAIEKTPHHINWIDRIISYVPNAKFVILYRNPYDFMLSYKHQGDRKPDKIKKEFKSLYHPIICSLIWRNYAKSIQEAQNKYPHQILLINLQEIKEKPDLLLKQIQNFFGLICDDELSKKIPQDNSSFPKGINESLEYEDIFWLNLIAKKEIVKLNFLLQNQSFNLYPIMLSLIKFPLTAIRGFFHIAKLTHPSSFWQYLLKIIKI